MTLVLSHLAVQPVKRTVTRRRCLGTPLLLLALLIGFSRVRLGVHYPSDVLIGQLMAAGTVSILRTVL